MNCKFCGKPIFWVEMRETGKKMPLNAKKDGSPKKVKGVQVNMETMTGFYTDIFSPHFGSCTAEGRIGLDKIYNS